jgi:NifU-like protein involved in Fe-S cluster formation
MPIPFAEYSPEVVDLFHRTPGMGQLDPGPDVFVGSAGIFSDGAEARFWVKTTGGRIETIRYRVYGCPHTIAAAAWIAERARGMTILEAERTVWLKVEGALAVPPQKRGRLLIVGDALRAALKAAAGNV